VTAPDLTPKQDAVLRWIADRTRERQYAPSIREIMAAFGLRSPNGVTCHVRALCKKGYLAHDPDTARSFRVLRLPGQDAPICPACGRALTTEEDTPDA
jgi:repressor LexA